MPLAPFQTTVAWRLTPEKVPDFADVSRIIVNRKEKAATDAAGLIIPAVGNNKLRHETLQRFMLANDSVTVAIEIPIWLTETDIAALEDQHGIERLKRRHRNGVVQAERADTSVPLIKLLAILPKPDNISYPD